MFFVINLFLTACSQNKDVSQNKDLYVKSLKSKSVLEIKNIIKSDTIILNKLLKEFNNFELTNSFFVSGHNYLQTKLLSEKPFRLDIDINRFKEEFDIYSKKIYFTQEYYYPNSEIKIESEVENEKIEDQIKYTYKKIYSNGSAVRESNIGLSEIDSIQVSSDIELPLEYENITIKKNDLKKIPFSGYIIEKDSIYKNTIEFKIPLELSNKIIAYQATSENNILMKATSSGKYPVKAISKLVISDINNLRNTFIKILKESDKNKIDNYLNGLTQNQFNSKNNLLKLSRYVDSIKSKKREFSVATFEEIGAKIFDVKKIYLIAEFPDNVKSMTIYVATKKIDLHIERTLKKYEISKMPYLKLKGENNYYNVFKNQNFKRGICDIMGNIIIPAIYDDIESEGNLYFNIYNNKKSELNWLDLENKKFTSLPKYYRFLTSIKKDVDVFSNFDYKSGILNKRKEIIVPFEHSDIKRFEDKIFLRNANTGKVTILDLNFKKLLNADFSSFSLLSNKYGLIIVGLKNSKLGIMNNNLNIITPYKYDKIEPLKINDDYFIVAQEKKTGYFTDEYLMGVIDDKGNEIVPLIYCNIEENENGNLKICKNDNSEIIDFNLFINKFKKSVKR